LLIVIAMLTLASCTDPDESAGVAPTKTIVSPTPSPTRSEEDAGGTVSPALVKANELGAIPVLMYHRITPHPESEFDRTPDAFRRELARLFRDGYRPVLARDLARGRIDVPAGKSPVVLTFDDSSREQFAYRRGRDVDPRTAVGILLSFARSHPAFSPVATMYVNRFPFASSRGAEVMRDLYRRGFELGNHTADHSDLSLLSASGVRRELALGVKVITSAVPGARVETMALPLGRTPRNKRLAVRGSWRGTNYRHAAVMLVGAEPAPSPFSKDFRPSAVPRIRSSSWNGKVPNYGSTFWLVQLRKRPEERFISDGDPRTISFPKKLKARLSPRFAQRAHPY
jgi:peptidoglycan/xylan/chitin deacetylase (PgdA/CDA1 family)